MKDYIKEKIRKVRELIAKPLCDDLYFASIQYELEVIEQLIDHC